MKKQNGFTLIELLVVIFIISILTGIGLVSFSGAQKQARDTTRRSDLGQYRNALENYAANNNGNYPPVVSTLATAIRTSYLTSYMSQGLEDPKATTDADRYQYIYNSTAYGYLLYAKIETGGYWFVCSNGVNNKLVSVPEFADCSASAPAPTPTPGI